MCTAKDLVDDTCFTGWSFILKEGISGNVDVKDVKFLKFNSRPR